MSTVRTNEGDFGRARVRLSGAADLSLEEFRGGIDTRDLAGRPPIVVIAAFRLASVDHSDDRRATVEVAVEGDARLILALLGVGLGLRIVPSAGTQEGFAVFTLDYLAVGTLVWIVECGTEADAAMWCEQSGGRPIRVGPATDGSRDPIDDVFFEASIGDLWMIPRVEQPRVMAAPEDPGRRARGQPRRAPGAETFAAPVSAPGDEAATSVPAHVSGEMPGVTVAGQTAIVEVTLSLDHATPAAGAVFVEQTVSVIGDRPVLVSIATRGYRLVARARRVRTLRLRPGKRKDFVRFVVEAVDPGIGEVILVFRQDGEFPLATLRLATQISEGPAVDQPVSKRADLAAPEADIRSLPTLRIDESFAASESYLDVAVQIGGDRVECRLKIIDKPQVISETYAAIARLRQARKHENPNGTTRLLSALDELRSIGVSLSLRLFHRAVRQFMWDHIEDLDHLVIQTTGEFDIPWEIIYVSDPTRSVKEESEVVVDHFLGMRGSTRWVYNTALPREVVVRQGRAWYLCPSYTDAGLALAFTQDEGKFVRGALRATAVRPGTAGAISKLMTDGFDLLHFAGHGVWSTTPPDQRLLLARFRKSRPAAADTSYSAATLRHDLPDRTYPTDDEAAPMVFLNACDIGRTDASALGLGGFPEAFLRGGVGIMVGCSWAIDDEIAGTFSRQFYEAIMTSDIGDAMQEARTRCLNDGDLSALAYVAYANPRARVVVT